MKNVMTPEVALAIYAILVRIGGAEDSMTFPFVDAVLRRGVAEWRFSGYLGFGGKYRVGKNRVDYYPEDRTPARDEIQAKINAALSAIEGLE